MRLRLPPASPGERLGQVGGLVNLADSGRAHFRRTAVLVFHGSGVETGPAAPRYEYTRDAVTQLQGGTQCCRCVEPHRIFRRSPFASVTYVRAAREETLRHVTSLSHAALLCTTAAPRGSVFAVAAQQKSAAVTRASFFSLGRNFPPFAAPDRFFRLEYCNESPEVSFA